VVAITALVLAGAAPRLYAGSFTQIVAFGDSLTDTGNVFNLAANTFPATPPYYNGRFSNGPLWVDVLASALGVPDPLPSRLGGTDYAYGGAETSLTGLSTRNTPNIGPQVMTYLNTHPTPTSSQLFIVWGGANDFLHYPQLPLPDPSLPVSNLSTEITELAQAGAKNFLVPNLPLLGETPYVKQQLAPNFPGIEATMNSLTTQFNSQLAVTESTLESSLGIKIYRLDVASLFQQVLANPPAFGFTDVMDQAKSGDIGVNGSVVPNPNHYLFWDPVHPTQTFHFLLGEAAIATVVPEPASVVMMGIGLATVGALVWRPRRPGRAASS
jgi:3-phytase